MAAESTPIGNSIGMSFFDVFDDVTPVRKNNFKRRKKDDSRERVVAGDDGGSGDDSDNELVMRSQVYKKRKSRERELETDKRISVVHNGNENNSNDLIEDDENFYVNVKSQYINNSIKFVDSGIDKLLLDVDYDLERDVDSNDNCSQVLNSKLFRDEFTVTDAVGNSEKSSMPQDGESYFSHLIKKKLLDNASNKEVVKSQTSGWTQYEFSKDTTPVLDNVGSFYGLPSRVREVYNQHKGISELYPWQQECLNLKAVTLRKNLVYALPTSGGKSLVSEILILKEILMNKKNVLLVLPFVSLVQEKIRDFSQFSLEFGFSVDEYAAGKGAIPPKKHRRRNSLWIATTEKALIIVNSLMEMNRFEELGMVVVDELHLIAEEGRGAILETLLIEILNSRRDIHIIGMTATIGNLEEVAAFLNADSYVGTFRPVRLTEYLKCGDKIYSINTESEELFTEIRTIECRNAEDTDGIGFLVEETVPNDSVLIFCPTKKNCENIALLLSHILPSDLTEHKKVEKASLYKALVSEMNDQICPILRKTVPFGIAYHHSGLTAGERKLLEEAFRLGTLCVICCTCTLAVGVNLPARRVLLRSPYIGRDFMSLSKYKQMVGRAGRKGFGSEGESYLICQPGDMEKVVKLFRSDMDDAISKMDTETCKDLVLSAVGLGTATSKKELRKMMEHSLLHHQFDKLEVDTSKMVDDCIETLINQGAITVKAEECEGITTCGKDLVPNPSQMSLAGSDCDTQLTISRLGRAAMKGGLTVETAHLVYSDLAKAQACLVLLTNLHLLYLVTPYDLVAQIKPNFSILFHVYMQFDSKELQAAAVIGITELVVSKLAVGVQPKNIKECVLNKFYVCLILNELWNQKTIWEVASLFQLPRGVVQTVMTSAATFANCVLRFCDELKEFWAFKSLLTDFAPRLAHCCAPELVPLMELPAVKRGRARQLYDAGFKTIEILACAKPSDLVRSVDHLPHKTASQIVAAAKMIITEKAEGLREEAENVLECLRQNVDTNCS